MKTGIIIYSDWGVKMRVYSFIDDNGKKIIFQMGEDGFWDLITLWIKRAKKHAEEV